MSDTPPPRPPANVVPPTRQELENLVRRASDPQRLYPLRSCKYYGLYCGRLDDGSQAVATLCFGNEFAIHYFDADGSLTRVERRKCEFAWEVDQADLDANDRELHDFLTREFRFHPALVRIKRVNHPDAWFTIDPLTERFEDFLRDPYDLFDDDDRSEIPVSIREWITNGEYVLNYNNDYWVDVNGEITSS